MVIMIMHGLIQGNLKAEYFAYAIVVSFAFYLWAVVDQKFRKATQSIDLANRWMISHPPYEKV